MFNVSKIANQYNLLYQQTKGRSCDVLHRYRKKNLIKFNIILSFSFEDLVPKKKLKLD